MKERIIRTLNLISAISTGTLIACLFWYGITLITKGEAFFEAQIPYLILGEILSIGVICGIGTELILGGCEEKTPQKVKLRILFHYIFVTAVVLVCGYFYDWYNPNIWGIIGMCLTSAAVYGFTFALNSYIKKKSADEMNKKLMEYNKK